MLDQDQEKGLDLTVEEALGLLEIIMASPAELSSDQTAAMVKLSHFCRQFLMEMQ